MFWNQHILIPILIFNDKDFKKTYTLKFLCPYNTPTFIISSDQFRKYNTNP
jgi:hypothetical protein